MSILAVRSLRQGLSGQLLRPAASRCFAGASGSPADPLKADDRTTGPQQVVEIRRQGQTAVSAAGSGAHGGLPAMSKAHFSLFLVSVQVAHETDEATKDSVSRRALGPAGGGVADTKACEPWLQTRRACTPAQFHARSCRLLSSLQGDGQRCPARQRLLASLPGCCPAAVQPAGQAADQPAGPLAPADSPRRYWRARQSNGRHRGDGQECGPGASHAAARLPVPRRRLRASWAPCRCSAAVLGRRHGRCAVGLPAAWASRVA